MVQRYNFSVRLVQNPLSFFISVLSQYVKELFSVHAMVDELAKSMALWWVGV